MFNKFSLRRLRLGNWGLQSHFLLETWPAHGHWSLRGLDSSALIRRRWPPRGASFRCVACFFRWFFPPILPGRAALRATDLVCPPWLWLAEAMGAMEAMEAMHWQLARRRLPDSGTRVYASDVVQRLLLYEVHQNMTKHALWQLWARYS